MLAEKIAMTVIQPSTLTFENSMPRMMSVLDCRNLITCALALLQARVCVLDLLLHLDVRLPGIEVGGQGRTDHGDQDCQEL